MAKIEKNIESYTESEKFEIGKSLYEFSELLLEIESEMDSR